jgi:hypothetical protein
MLILSHVEEIFVVPSPGTERPEREADHSTPSSTKVKNGGAIPLLLHTSLLCINEAQGHLSFRDTVAIKAM